MDIKSMRKLTLKTKFSSGQTFNITIGSFKDEKQLIEIKRECCGGSCASDDDSQEIEDQFITNSNESIDPNKVSFVYGNKVEGTGSRFLNPRYPYLSMADVYPNSTNVRKLRKRESMSAKQGDNSHGSITDEVSSSFEKTRKL